MSRTERGQPGPGKDWWAKRPLSGTHVNNRGMKRWKRRLHKIERKDAKAESVYPR